VSALQVKSSLHSSFPQSSGLLHFLGSSGLDEADLEFEVRAYLTGQALIAHHGVSTPTITAAQIAAYYAANRSQIGNETLAQATPDIREALIDEAEAPKVDPYLSSVQRYWAQRTVCAPGYRIASYCGNS
jgi:hypothetical protein